MQNLWNETEAAQYSGALNLRVYTSRLLGRNPDLVLHGGGNTSVKIRERNVFGEEEEILYVKGSGWNLETIEAAGFSPVRMAHLLKLAQLPTLGDIQMARELRVGLTNPAAPDPSVEAILHALLPYPFVDHTHADAIVTLTNTPNGEAHIRELYGERMVIIPYVMPGFKLAKVCAELFARHAGAHTLGMILMSHGIFTFGATAKESYDRMIELVTEAEEFLNQRVTARPAAEAVAEYFPEIASPQQAARNDSQRLGLATLRHAVSQAAGFPVILSAHTDEQTLNFARHPRVQEISQRGPATPDHVIRTKRVPLIGRDVAEYTEAYRAYFQRNTPHAAQPLTMLDPAPRVILDEEFGLLTVGRTATETAIAEDIYRHTIKIILQAEALGDWRALSEADIFEVEYWDLEQAKLKRAGAPKMFAGEVALVTGAASGIGKACAESLLARGAAVVGVDINPAITTTFKRADFHGVVADLSDAAQIGRALSKTVLKFGGLDMLILNAGIFPASRRIAELSDAEWARTLHINTDANLTLLRETHPLLKLAPRGGRVAVIASKNVPAPGPGAAAYSASKAALTQLARVAALEWGADNIRLNILHPDAVFDTGLWTDEVLQARAAHYKLTVQEYKTKNILRAEVKSRDVAELAAELCGPLFAKTTGAQIPVDGGNDRVI
jgi:rhamnose utilization protein RhaD (predicted bifunctional aldolase and dehydrogenase)/NAD(P)-dependent dehydrogenase (short-subunit alcohol dehydrogenase family)